MPSIILPTTITIRVTTDMVQAVGVSRLNIRKIEVNHLIKEDVAHCSGGEGGANRLSRDTIGNTKSAHTRCDALGAFYFRFFLGVQVEAAVSFPRPYDNEKET